MSKVGKIGWIVFTALAYLGFHLEPKKQIYTSQLLFSTRSLVDGWSDKLTVHREQFVKWYYCIPLDFPQILLTTTFYFSFSAFGFICFSVFFCFTFLLFVSVRVFFLFETKNMYSNTHATMLAGKWWKNFYMTDFRKQYNFFLALQTIF